MKIRIKRDLPLYGNEVLPRGWYNVAWELKENELSGPGYVLDTPQGYVGVFEGEYTTKEEWMNPEVVVAITNGVVKVLGAVALLMVVYFIWRRQ